MRWNTITLLTGLAAVLLTGCETPSGAPNQAGTGALVGGAFGAASGAIIGGHDAGPGALIGGAIGALTGGLIGHTMDLQTQERLRAQAPQTYVRVDQGQPLSLADIKALAAARVSDDVIISQIRNSRTIFHLSSADIIDLKNSGVDERVIDYMINTPSAIARVTPGRRMVQEPAGATPPPPATVTAPPPAPPPQTAVAAPGPGYVWIDGEWMWNGNWYWVAGRWAVPPYPHAVWEHGYWTRGPYGYRRVPGHWR